MHQMPDELLSNTRTKRIFYEAMGWYWKTEPTPPPCEHKWEVEKQTPAGKTERCTKCGLARHFVIVTEGNVIRGMQI